VCRHEEPHTGNVQTLDRGAAIMIQHQQTEQQKLRWTNVVLKEQGCENKTTIYQDNTSVMSLEKNHAKQQRVTDSW